MRCHCFFSFGFTFFYPKPLPCHRSSVTKRTELLDTYEQIDRSYYYYYLLICTRTRVLTATLFQSGYISRVFRSNVLTAWTIFSSFSSSAQTKNGQTRQQTPLRGHARRQQTPPQIIRDPAVRAPRIFHGWYETYTCVMKSTSMCDVTLNTRQKSFKISNSNPDLR